MAKEIIITGPQARLESLTDEWGGVNNTGETITKYGVEIPDGYKWGMNFAEVERFIKSLFNGQTPSALSKLLTAVAANKIGCLRTWDDELEGELHLLGFASVADYEAWLEDPENVTPLNDIIIPKGGNDGFDPFIARLVTNADANTPMVLTSRNLSVGLRFSALQMQGGQYVNAGEIGTLTFQRSVDGGTNFDTVGTALISSRDENSVVFDPFDIGQYLAKDRSCIIRVQASFKARGNTYSSVWVQLATATFTELTLTCESDWYNPIAGSRIRETGFPLTYKVNGAVAKTLHIWVQGTNGRFINIPLGRSSGSVMKSEGNNLTAAQHGVNVTYNLRDTSNLYGIDTHGIHAVAAWLTCDDGLGGTLSSNILVNRFMVVDEASAGANATKPYVMIQNVITQVDNFVQTRIFDYAVFNPVVENGVITAGTDPVPLKIYVTNYNDDFPEGNVVSYFVSEVNALPGRSDLYVDAAIEIESETEGILDSYLRVWSEADGELYNIMADSITDYEEVVDNGYIWIGVNNTDSFTPTLGASFVLNPKLRNNEEANPKRIVNAKTNAEVGSTWTGFENMADSYGWITAEDGTKVLRVVAGQRLNIEFNPFAQFLSTPNSSMTLELDFKVFNITDEESPIFKLSELVGGNPRGLILKPMEGNIYTLGNTVASETNFRWEENVRTFIAVNIHNNVVPNVRGDGLYNPETYPNPAQSGFFVRIFVGDNIQRELLLDGAEAQRFCTDLMSNGGITIGQDSADIDIYSIRCYANTALEAEDVVKDWISTLPTSAEKVKARAENRIMSGNRVDVEKVKALGKRVLIMHGDEPYHSVPTSPSCWWEIFQYDDAGNYLPELSGTICRDTTIKKVKRQGSTANTYYYSNIQTKVSESGGKISVPLADIHESITVGEPYESTITETVNGESVTRPATVVDIYGGNLGKKDPVQADPNKYEYIDGNVLVPDGWIDGNGKYRGVGFMVAAGTPLADKLVLKINYASSMQSHLCGGTRLYSDLHTAVVGRNSMQQAVASARVAKYTEPVFFFTQAYGSDEAIFRGGGNFGAGKMDKPTWGYVKSLHPMFTMIEGSDNNYHLTDMRVPFVLDEDCSEHVTYSPDDEGWFYAGLQQLDFDGGKTDKVNSKEYPVSGITNRVAETWNWLYMHSPNIAVYIGTFANFVNSNSARETAKKWWCSDNGDGEAFKLKRYDYVNSAWVDAGPWDETNKVFETIDLREHEYTAYTYEISTNKRNYARLNLEFIAAIVADAKKYIGFYFKPDSLLFHYAFQNHFIAGTDNCSKNTYFVLDPVAQSVTIDGETRSCYLWELHQDDVDTILLTDNNGRSTKPYYIDRMHPYADDDPTTSCYEGTNNVLFNLVEAMWEDTREIQNMLKSIFNAMTTLVTAEDVQKGYSRSIMGCMEKYLLSIQKFYPGMAYNEQARIRYEWPALLGFVSTGSGARSIPPITQSMGSQLQAERQFIKRRVLYMASYAAWGQLYDGGKTYSIGISEAGSGFSLQAFHLPGEVESNNNYTFYVVPHMYLYPTGMLGQTAVDPHVRVAPGVPFALNLGNTTSNDTGMTVLGRDLYRSFGNVGDLSAKPDVTPTVLGDRLIEFIAEPSVTYQDGNKVVGAYRPSQINFGAKFIRDITLKDSGISGELDLRQLVRLETLDIRGTYITEVKVPASDRLTTVHLPGTLFTLSLVDCTSLETVDLEGYDTLTKVTIKNTPAADSLTIVSGAISTLTDVDVDNVNWRLTGQGGLTLLNALATLGSKCKLSGTIQLRNVTPSFDDKALWITAWGDVDHGTNGLTIDYTTSPISAVHIISGKYLESLGDHKMRLSSEGNNFTAVRWEITTNSYATIEDPSKGIVTVWNLDEETQTPCAEVTVYVTLVDGTVLSDTKMFYFCEHICREGDYVYADGSFSDELLSYKTVVALCFYINPSDPLDRLAVSRSNLVYDHWGLYNDSSNGVSGVTVDGYTTIYDTPVTNITKNGNSDIDNLVAMSSFATYDRDTAVGDVGFFTLRQDYLDVSRFITGDEIHIGQYKTLQLMRHRNTILRGVVGNSAVVGSHVPEVPAATANLTEREVLTNLIQDIVSKKGNRYRQLYYPAASYCYAYQPTYALKPGEVLADKFLAHNWWLPTLGELGMVYWQQQHSTIFADAIANGIYSILTSDNNSGYYWTSTEYSATFAYNLHGGTGAVYSNISKYTQRYVRAVVAI